MAIIYTYPTKASPAADDLILISDSADSNKTKQIKVSALPSSGAGITLTTNDTSGVATLTGTVLNIPNYTTTGGTPATPLNSVQFNNASAFGGDANLTFTGTPNPDTLTLAHKLDIKGDGTSNAGKLKLYCQDNTTPHYVELIGPAHSGSPVSYSITLPNKIATQSAVSGGRVLEVDASGVGNWITTPTSGGSVSITADNTSTDYVDVQVSPSTITGTGTVMADLNAVDGTSDTTTKFLSKDNTWDVPSYTTDAMGSGNSYLAGLVLAGSATHNDEFLRKDGTWQATASYSEGTWTPSLTFGGGQAVPTLSTASGNYVIIGKYVYANFYVVVQAGTQYSGSLPRISLPVAAASHNGGILMMSNAYTAASQNTSIILGSVVGGMSIVGLKTMDVSGSEVRIQNLASSPLTYYNNAALSGSIIYLKS